MAKEAVVQLFRAAQVNPTLRDQLAQAPSITQFVAMAQTHGYQFTVEEWQEVTQFQVEELKGELSEIPGL